MRLQELPPDVLYKVSDFLPLKDLMECGPLSQQWQSAKKRRIRQARDHIKGGLTLGCWDKQFISTINLVIFRFLSCLDLLTGRADSAIPVVHVDNEGVLSLPGRLEHRGVTALIYVPDDTHGLGPIPRLYANICVDGKVVAVITVGRLPAKVMLMVRGKQSLLQPALSAAIQASLPGITEWDPKVGVPLEILGYEVAFNDIQLEDSMLAGSRFLCRGFVAGSILVLPSQGEAFKPNRLRFAHKGGRMAVQKGMEDMPPPLKDTKQWG